MFTGTHVSSKRKPALLKEVDVDPQDRYIQNCMEEILNYEEDPELFFREVVMENFDYPAQLRALAADEAAWDALNPTVGEIEHLTAVFQDLLPGTRESWIEAFLLIRKAGLS